MFYADLNLPLRGVVAQGITQEGAQCSIIQARGRVGVATVMPWLPTSILVLSCARMPAMPRCAPAARKHGLPFP